MNHCGNHQNRLNENGAKEATDTTHVMSRLSSFISMLRSSGHYFRMIATVYVTVHENLFAMRADMPEGKNNSAERVRAAVRCFRNVHERQHRVEVADHTSQPLVVAERMRLGDEHLARARVTPKEGAPQG